MSSMMSKDKEIEQLRKKLLHARNIISELQDELKEQEDVRYKLTTERDRYRAKIVETKDSIKRADEIIQIKVNEAIAEERAHHRRTEQELIRTKEYLRQIERRREELEATNLDYNDRVKDLSNQLDILEGNTGSEALQQKMNVIKDLKDDRRDRVKELNEMAENLEDVLAENRILRKMNNVPDNWGFEAQKRIIKLQDRESVFEYKRLVKILQEDNYNLEKERAHLKHRLKQLAIYGGMSKDEKYRDLTPEQVIRLNEFLIRLRQGEVEDEKSMYELMEENKALKKELEILQTKGYNVIKQQLEIFFRDNRNIFVPTDVTNPMPNTMPADMTDEQRKFMESLKKQQDQMKGIIDNINSMQAYVPNNVLTIGQDEAGRFGPPRVTGIGTGYSTKFGTDLSIPMGGSASPKDLPALQLQLIEMFALNERKDSQIKMLEGELERAYTRVRRYLLMQDQLYLNYAEELQGFKDKTLKHEENLMKAKDELREEQIKNENYRKAIRSLKLDPDSMSNELVNLQKKLALVEVENFKLAKKYSIIYEQEKQLREAYHKIEEGFTERERFATERIKSIKEWQMKAINEIKFLYSKFRDAIPLSEYQTISKDLFIYKQKFADMMEKCNRQVITNSRLQTENRELLTAGERLKMYEELKIDTENELEVIKKRLELVDPLFKWENAIFNRVIAVLKQKRISPRQIFDHADTDGTGKLSSKEFFKVLEKMGVIDLNNKEREMLLRSIDSDMDGTVDYREFCRKCGRFGVVSRSREDEIVYVIDQTLKRHNLELSEMFEIMDKNGQGVITKDDFKDTLINSRVKVDRRDLENFVDLFWKGRDEGINIRDFIRIYNKFKVRFEEMESNRGKVRGQIEVTDEMIERMKWIFDKLKTIFDKNDISLRDAFNRIDHSSDKKITRIELKRMFDSMGVTVRDNELEMIFRRLDFDDSGAVTYVEFETEFDKITQTPLENLKALNIDSKSRSSAKFSGGNYKQLSEDYLLSEEVTNARKINILESKVKQYENKFDMYKTRLQKSEDSQITWERDYDLLEKKYLEINEKYQGLLEREQATNAQLVGTLSREKSEDLVLKYERQNEQITDLKAAMDGYKSLFEVASSQAKTLKLSNKRARDEEENLMYALRELQSDSVDKLKLGRIYYILMLSRWQEAAIGMKYDYVLNDIRTLRGEYSHLEIRIKREEDHRHTSENKLREKSLQVEQLKQELHAKTASGISMARAEEISKALQDLADEKSDVEEKYIKIYAEINDMRFKVTEYESRLEHSESMLYILRNSTESEISERLLELSDKLSQIRRNELRSKRESEEYQEKANYAEKRVSQQKKTIVDLEDQLADIESMMHRKEEQWRRADNERQKKFFDLQFTNFETENRFKGYQDDGDNVVGLEKDKFNREDLVSPPVGEFLIKKSDVRIMQAKLRNAGEEIVSLQTQIQSKDKQLNRLREWQLEDKLLGEDEKIRDIMDSNKVRIDQMHEEESREMAQAAYKTIKTLQELVEDKNKQNKRKEGIINELKQRMIEQKQTDTREIVRLNEDLGKALKEKSEADYSFRETHISREHKEYEAISRRELERLVYQKDDEIENLANQVTSLRREKEYLLENKDAAERDTFDTKNDELADRSSKRVRALQKDVDRLTRQLNDKKRVEDRLNDTIRQITDKLTRLEEMKGITDEDIKMAKLSKTDKDDDKYEKLDKLLQRKERILGTERAKNKTINKDLKEAKAKILELQEKEHELKQEVTNALAEKQRILDNQQKERFLAKKKEREAKKSTDKRIEGSSNLELKTIVRDLERQMKVLKNNQKPMVAYNGQNGAFEYIGEPVPLKNDQTQCQTIEEILTDTKQWLKANDRITVAPIFNSFDYNKSGFIEPDLLIPIFARLGIQLHKDESDIIFNCLNKEDEDLCKYRPLVVELTTGPAQLEFIPDHTIRVAKLATKNDTSHFNLLNKIDPNKNNKTSHVELKDGLDGLFPGEVSNKLADDIFDNYKITEDEKTMDPVKFCDRVKEASIALTIKEIKTTIDEKGREYARDAREGNLEETKGLSIDNEFSKIDREHDGLLTFDQFKSLLDVYGLENIKDNARADLMDMLDVDNKFMISLSYIKQVLDLPRSRSADAHFGLDMKPMKDDYRQKEDAEIEDNARKALKRIYQNNNLLDRLHKQLKVYDHDKDGVMSRGSLHQAIVDVTKNVHEDDVNYVTKYADKRNKGYFNPEHFFDNITKLAQEEAKNDAILRRLGNVLRHKGIDLEKELTKQSKINTGVIDTYDFVKAMREMRIGLDSSDMDDLVNYASQGERYVEIKWFCKKVEDALNSKPMSVTAPKIKKDKVPKGSISEKEHKRALQKLQILTNQLNDARRDYEKAEKNAQDWKVIAEKNEKSLNILSDKVLDPKDKARRIGDLKDGGVSSKMVKQQLKQQERILELDNMVLDLENKNEDLEKLMEVDTKVKLHDYEMRAKDAEKRLRSLKSENLSLQSQIDKLIAANTTFDKNEEAEYARQMNTKSLENRIKDLEAVENQLQHEILESQHKQLDMGYDRANFQNKIATLKDKINDLETYIQIHAMLPSLGSKKGANKESEADRAIKNATGLSKRSNEELEKVIEGLKRVINSQKSEIEQLKKKKAKNDKVSSNKVLKDELETLEKELQSFQNSENELTEMKAKVDKLTEANRALMNDVDGEQKRYEFLEAKYKELLVKYNVACKDLEKKQDSLFSMSTGANRATYQEYLEHKKKLQQDQD